MTSSQDEIDYGNDPYYDRELGVAIAVEKLLAGFEWNNERELEFRKRWEAEHGKTIRVEKGGLTTK